MEKVKRIQVGSQTVGGDGKLFVMAGPCVIEDPERTLAIGKTMKAICEKLGLTYIFKASFDKANRSSYTSYRGPGLKEGLRILADIKKELQVPVVSDIHETCQAEAAAEVLDVIQIPAFLCRQTDLLEAAAATGKCVNVKKGQFLAPEDMKNVVAKIEHAGNENIMLTERGISLGYHNLVVDMRSFPIMRSFGYPVVFDATHSVQLPGGAGTCVNGDAVVLHHGLQAADVIRMLMGDEYAVHVRHGQPQLQKPRLDAACGNSGVQQQMHAPVRQQQAVPLGAAGQCMYSHQCVFPRNKPTFRRRLPTACGGKLMSYQQM